MGLAKEIMKTFIVTLVVDVILVSLRYVAESYGLSFPYNLLQMEFPLWITILALIIIIPTIVMASRRRFRAGVGSLGIARQRPRSDVVNLTYNYAGVNWKVLFGRFSPFRKEEPYAFCEAHPYCPECEYEMEAEKSGFPKRYHWKCDKCGKSYRCPVNPSDADRIVEKTVESDFRTGKLKYPYPTFP